VADLVNDLAIATRDFALPMYPLERGRSARFFVKPPI